MSSNTYLIIPSVPTPNGRLHLGHIGGPYLRADVLARYLKSQGHQAFIITGTDSYESYVTARADEENRSPSEVCHYYHDLIESDLRAMKIQIDLFVNPLAEAWRQRYVEWHQSVLRKLVDANAVVRQQERVQWDEQHHRYQAGCWLAGRCPMCESEVRGYFCERCGAHFKPEEVAGNLVQNEVCVSNLFMTLPEDISLMDSGVSPEVQFAFQQFLLHQHSLFRLTANSDWGLLIDSERVYFNYGFMYAYFLMFGELLGELVGSQQNAFSIHSSVQTICCFGLDNAVPFLASTLGITAAIYDYKPFDYYLINHFYYLDGFKFSTSRRHAIWVSDVANLSDLEIDILRFYLMSIDVSRDVGHFDTKKFQYFKDDLLNFVTHKLSVSKNYFMSEVCDSEFNKQIVALFECQQKFFEMKSFSPHLAVQSIQEWMRVGQDIDLHSSQYYWWLKALSFVLLPFMPKLSEMIWQGLGCHGPPNRINFFHDEAVFSGEC